MSSMTTSSFMRDRSGLQAVTFTVKVVICQKFVRTDH